MFNITLTKEALRIHDETLRRYNTSYEKMGFACETLYAVRGDLVDLIKLVERVINSIANTPKDFNIQMGKVGKELTKFKETEEYAKKAYNTSIKAGVNIVGGAAAGIGMASMAPTALMSIATTFGTASTGTAISTLAGPIGWGITAASTSISLISLTAKNKELADNAIEEAKEIAKAREALDETTEKVNALKTKTDVLYNDMNKQRNSIAEFANSDYQSLAENDQYFLGALANNALSLSVLLNETIE